LGFFDILRKGKESEIKYNVDNNERISNPYVDSQAISSLSKAYIRLNDSLGLKSTGQCGICVKNVDVQDFHDMKQYIDNFLGNVSDKQKIGWNFSYKSIVDNYGYLWFILNGEAIEDIVVAINAIGDTIHEKGFSRQLLAAVFEFTSGYSTSNHTLNNTKTIEDQQYIIYNYKLDKFYPFVPIPSNMQRKRNHELEMKIMYIIVNEIPFEKDYSLWYPIWNLPF
jgi:hypothetical protein